VVLLGPAVAALGHRPRRIGDPLDLELTEIRRGQEELREVGHGPRQTATFAGRDDHHLLAAACHHLPHLIQRALDERVALLLRLPHLPQHAASLRVRSRRSTLYRAASSLSSGAGHWGRCDPDPVCRRRIPLPLDRPRRHTRSRWPHGRRFIAVQHWNSPRGACWTAGAPWRPVRARRGAFGSHPQRFSPLPTARVAARAHRACGATMSPLTVPPPPTRLADDAAARAFATPGERLPTGPQTCARQLARRARERGAAAAALATTRDALKGAMAGVRSRASSPSRGVPCYRDAPEGRPVPGPMRVNLGGYHSGGMEPSAKPAPRRK
jgi:hypothetical protein